MKLYLNGEDEVPELRFEQQQLSLVVLVVQAGSRTASQIPVFFLYFKDHISNKVCKRKCVHKRRI